MSNELRAAEAEVKLRDEQHAKEITAVCNERDGAREAVKEYYEIWSKLQSELSVMKEQHAKERMEWEAERQRDMASTIAVERQQAEEDKQAILARCNNEELDCTDAACPAWWRGHEWATKVVCQKVCEILDGRDVGNSTQPKGQNKMGLEERVEAVMVAAGCGKDRGPWYSDIPTKAAIEAAEAERQIEKAAAVKMIILTLEIDDDGEFIVSDSFSTIYGNGTTSKLAVKDYCVSLIEYLKLRDKQHTKLYDAIKEVHSQHADDLCWMDIDKIFAAAWLPVPNRSVGDKVAMLKNCDRFINLMCQGGKWKSYAELEAEVNLVREQHAKERMEWEAERQRDMASTIAVERQQAEKDKQAILARCNNEERELQAAAEELLKITAHSQGWCEEIILGIKLARGYTAAEAKVAAARAEWDQEEAVDQTCLAKELAKWRQRAQATIAPELVEMKEQHAKEREGWEKEKEELEEEITVANAFVEQTIAAALAQAKEEYADKTSRMRAEIIAHRSKANGDYWSWQDDGLNALESLVCPVLIPADDLLRLINAPAEAEERHANDREKLVEIIEELRSEATTVKAAVAAEKERVLAVLSKSNWLGQHQMSLGEIRHAVESLVYLPAKVTLPADTDEFVQHLKRAAEIVASWPEWKQNILRSAAESVCKPVVGCPQCKSLGKCIDGCPCANFARVMPTSKPTLEEWLEC